MAKYSGIFDLKGTIGGLSFYKRKGVNCVRRPGGFSKERLLTDPNLRRVVEHNTEFGAVSTASKSVRTALASVQDFYDGTFPNRLIKIGFRIIAAMEGVHGQRPVAFSLVKPILNRLQLNAKCSLESSLAMAIKSNPSPERNSAELRLDIDVPVAVTAPQGSTHFRLVHALAVVSDYEYEPALGGFIPLAFKVDGLGASSHSDYISLNEKTVSHNFNTILPVREIPGNATVLEVLGISFYQALGKVYESLQQGKAARVIGVY